MRFYLPLVVLICYFFFTSSAYCWQFQVNDPKDGIDKVHPPIELFKRQNDQVNEFVWPEVDGPWSNAIPLINNSFAVVGYWTFNQTFFNLLQEIGKINETLAEILLFKASLENLYLWVKDCFEISNSSAKANERIDTVARVIAIPSNDPKLFIDPQHIASPVQFSCFERQKDDDINSPLFDYTNGLLKKLKWDKADALADVKQRQSAGEGGSSS